MHGPWKQGDGTGSPWTGLRDGCALPCPLQEQKVLLTTGQLFSPTVSLMSAAFEIKGRQNENISISTWHFIWLLPVCALMSFSNFRFGIHLNVMSPRSPAFVSCSDCFSYPWNSGEQQSGICWTVFNLGVLEVCPNSEKTIYVPPHD